MREISLIQNQQCWSNFSDDNSWTAALLSFFAIFNTKFQRNGDRSELLLKNHPSSKKKSVESESRCGSYCWFKINYFFRNFVTARQFQRENEILESPDIGFKDMERCRMIIPFPKTGYNKYSKLYWPSYAHFKSGAAFEAGSLWRCALLPRFSRHLLHIHQFQHSSVRLGLFGDIPSHLKLCRHLLFHQQSTSRLWVNRTKSFSSKSIC